MSTATLNRKVAAKARDKKPWMRVGIYVRISDDREGRELGVTRQEKDCRKLAARDGDTVVDVYKDNDIGASTRSKKPRPDYKRLLRDAKSGRINKIIAYTSGRLTRRPKEHEGQIELAEQYGTVFRYVASPDFDLNTAAGRRIARILAANDAGEAEDISERVCREKLQRLENGEYIGGARAFGWEGAKYDADGVIINKKHVGMRKIKSEVKLIKDARKRVVAGESLYVICREWTAKGIETPRGGKEWYPQTLKRILTNPRNAGLIAHYGEKLTHDGDDGPEFVKAKWKPIFTIDEYLAVCGVLNDDTRAKYRGSRSLKWLGTNLYLCGRCGALMRSAGLSSEGVGGEKHAAYRCKGGLHLSIRADWVDDAVHETIRDLLTRYGEGLIEAPQRRNLAPLYDKVNTLQARAKDIENDYADGEISKAEYRRLKIRNTTKLNSAIEELDANSTGSVLTGVADALDPAAAYDRLPIERKRAVADTLITVTIAPPTRKGRLPKHMKIDADRLQIRPKHPAIAEEADAAAGAVAAGQIAA